MNAIIQNSAKFAVATLMAVLATSVLFGSINQAAQTDLNGVSFSAATVAGHMTAV